MSVVSLCFAGAFSLGASTDFAMRASIPSLLVLMMLTIRTLNSSIHIATVNGKQKFRIQKVGIAIAILLIIGTATPLTECRRAVSAVLEYHQLNLVADDVKTLSDKPPEDVSYFLSVNYKDSNFYKYLQKQS